MVSLTVTGCAAAVVDEEPTVAPSVEAESAEPEVTEQPIPAADYRVSRESVQVYIDMTPDQFATLPKVEQLKLVAYYMQGSDELGGLIEFARNYFEVSGDPRDALPEIIGAENTADEIASVMGYTKRFVFALEGDERQKVLYAVLQRGTSSPSYSILYSASLELPDTSERIARIMAGTASLSAVTATDSTAMIQDETGTYKEVTFQNGQVDRIYFYEIPMDEGTFKIWIDE